MKKKNSLLEKLYTLILAAIFVIYLVLILTVLGMPLDQLEGSSLMTAGKALLVIIEDLGVIAKLYHLQIYMLLASLGVLVIIFIIDVHHTLKIRYITGGVAAVLGLFGLYSIKPLVDNILVPLLNINATTADGATRFLQSMQEISNTSLDNYLIAGYAVGASVLLLLLSMITLLVCIIRKK